MTRHDKEQLDQKAYLKGTQLHAHALEATDRKGAKNPKAKKNEDLPLAKESFHVTTLDVDKFFKWVKDDKTHTKELADYAALNLSAMKIIKKHFINNIAIATPNEVHDRVGS